MYIKQNIGKVKKTSYRKKYSNIISAVPKIITKPFRSFNFKIGFQISSIFIILILTAILIGLTKNDLNSFRSQAFSIQVDSRHANYTSDFDLAVLGTKYTEEEINKSGYFSNSLQTKDIRAYVFDEYFKQNASPLYGHGQAFVDACERYEMVKDCIGMVAVAEHETSLCKYYNSAQMFNCWGWGGGGEYRIKFNSIEESIDEVTKRTMWGYGNRFFKDFRNGQDYFCGTQDECIGWGFRVNNISEKIDLFAEQLVGFRLTSLR